MTHTQADQDQVVDLAAILNILWRRRFLVLAVPLIGLLVGVLYGMFGTRRWEAYATIRPGITAYDPSGGPARQWQLKDITRWYEQELYRRNLVSRLGLPKKSHPMIRAQFIAQGLTNLAGGDVITLWTTATSPELAGAILDTSLVLFNEYAESDSVSSQIKLTRDGLNLRLQELRNQLLGVEKQESSLGLPLRAARAESVMIEGKTRELGIDLDLLQRKEDFCRRRVKSLVAERPQLLKDMNQIEGVSQQVAAGAIIDTTAIPVWVRRNAVLDGGDILDGLSRARLDVRRALTTNQARSDSLAYEAERAALERSRLEFQKAASIKAELRDVERKIGDLELERELDIPFQRHDLRIQMQVQSSKLTLLSPLQKVGETMVSDEPVRPRMLRAILILVFLGMVGGIVLGFAWEYVSRNRRQIFQS